MLIDPHVNPRDLSPAELIDSLIEASVDGAVIACTHSAQDAIPYIKALIDDDFICYAGVELRTEHGTLVFIPRDAGQSFFSHSWSPNDDQAVFVEDEKLWSTDALFSMLKQQDGVICLSHPYTRLLSRSWGDRAFTLEGVTASASRIGRGLAHRDFLSDEICKLKGWARLGTSGGDSQFLGSAMTVVAEDVEDQASLCHALRLGACWPIEFEDPMFPRARYQGVVEDEGPRRQSLDERERREALNRVARQRGYEVEEAIDHRKPEGRWSNRSDQSATNEERTGNMQSRGGQGRGGQSRGGQSRGGQGRGGQGRGAQSRGGQSRGGQSRGGQSRGGQSRGGQSHRAYDR